MHVMSDRPLCYNRLNFQWLGHSRIGCSQDEGALKYTPGCLGCKHLCVPVQIIDNKGDVDEKNNTNSKI